MRTFVGGLIHLPTTLHDYRDAHRVKIQVEKEHLVMVLGYGAYIFTHSPAIVFASYTLVMVFQGKAMVLIDNKSH